MGALIAFLLAGRRRYTIDRLAIVDFGPDSMGPEMVAGWTASLLESSLTTYAGVHEAHVAWRSANPRARPRELRHFLEHNLWRDKEGQVRWRFDADRLAGFLGQLPDEQAMWSALNRVPCPALVIRGEHSEVLSAPTAARMTRELADGRLVQVRDGAHDLTVEQPRALAVALRSFLFAGGER